MLLQFVLRISSKVLRMYLLFLSSNEDDLIPRMW